jgi:hypothetical protein
MCRRENGQEWCILFLILVTKLFAVPIVSVVVASRIPVKVGRTGAEMASWKLSPVVILLCYLASRMFIPTRIVGAVPTTSSARAMCVILLFFIVVVLVVIVIVVIIISVTEWAMGR